MAEKISPQEIGKGSYSEREYISTNTIIEGGYHEKKTPYNESGCTHY